MSWESAQHIQLCCCTEYYILLFSSLLRCPVVIPTCLVTIQASVDAMRLPLGV